MRPSFMRVGALLLGMAGLPAAASSQAREPAASISPDRPGLGNVAHVLAPGVWQLELGGTVEADVGDDYLVGTSLLRFGFSALELRIFLPDVVSLHQGNFLRLGDLGLGVKIPMRLGAENWRWAATGSLTLPTGSESLSADGATGFVSVVGETSVTETVGFVMNIGAGAPFDDPGGGTLTLIATPVLAVPGHEGLAVYLGYAGFVREGDDDHIIEGGFAKLDGPDRQWDVNAGYDPGGHTWFLGAGVSLRRR